MQILSDSLLQYIYNYNRFDTIYFCVLNLQSFVLKELKQLFRRF